MDDILNNQYIRDITKILKDVGERVEGNLICDITPDNYVIKRNENKIQNLQYLAKDKKKIIEIGVNACHSLLLMLLVNPTAEYLLFDLNVHKYTLPTFNYIKTNFPDTKINIILGDSTQTMYKYIVDNPNDIKSYDLIHLDGGHAENVFKHDYMNSRKLIADEGVVIFDDYNYPHIKHFVDQKIKENEIVELVDKNIQKTNLHLIYRHK